MKDLLDFVSPLELREGDVIVNEDYEPFGKVKSVAMSGAAHVRVSFADRSGSIELNTDEDISVVRNL